MEKTALSEAGTELAQAPAQLAEAVTQLRAIVEVMGGHLLRSLEESTAMYQVGRNTTRL